MAAPALPAAAAIKKKPRQGGRRGFSTKGVIAGTITAVYIAQPRPSEPGFFARSEAVIKAVSRDLPQPKARQFARLALRGRLVQIQGVIQLRPSDEGQGSQCHRHAIMYRLVLSVLSENHIWTY